MVNTQKQTMNKKRIWKKPEKHEHRYNIDKKHQGRKPNNRMVEAQTRNLKPQTNRDKGKNGKHEKERRKIQKNKI